MTYLLDTNVVSELRKPARKISPAVRVWADSQQTRDLSISVITVMEVGIGVARLQRRDPQQSPNLHTWLEDGLLPAFAGRILPIDLETARLATSLHAPATCPERDALIAATALRHRLAVVTRNVADFAPMGVPVLNPWDG